MLSNRVSETGSSHPLRERWDLWSLRGGPSGAVYKAVITHLKHFFTPKPIRISQGPSFPQLVTLFLSVTRELIHPSLPPHPPAGPRIVILQMQRQARGWDLQAGRGRGEMGARPPPGLSPPPILPLFKVSHQEAGSQRARRGGESLGPSCTFIRGSVVKDHLAEDEPQIKLLRAHTLQPKHCLGEAERSRLQAGLSYRPKGAATARALGSAPQTQPGATSWPCPRPQPPPVIVAPSLGSGGPARRTPASTDTLPGDHKFMNPRSCTCAGQEQSLAALREDIFLCQATERSTKTPAVRPQSPSL